MLNNLKFLARALAFFIILTVLIIETNYILTPKKYFDNSWPTTATYKGFYQMRKDSIDVLFFGSSHVASGINPQEIYNNYGIKSYNLGCEQQNLIVSYYWLKEAIKYQKLKAVVLDTHMLFEFDHAEALNTSEPCTRMAMDAMRWSRVKYEAIKTICDNDERQEFNSYLFKNIRFHTRWTLLSEQDFSFKKYEKHYELKGFAPFNSRGVNVKLDYLPYDSYEETEEVDSVPLMYEHLEKINKLCDENNIQLILIKTPTTQWDASKHRYVAEYADNNALEFIDFNDKDIYDACGFIFSEDMNDNGHSNIWGANKISLYLAKTLYESYGIGGGDFYEQWADTNDYYQRVLEDCMIKHITDLDEYITAIDQDRYTILISTMRDMSAFVDDDVKREFSRLGLDLEAEPNSSYYAAISDYNTVQLSAKEVLKYSGSTRGKLQDFTIVSGGYDAGTQCSIIIGNTEYAKCLNGINIVVYSEETRKVVDSVSFNGRFRR